MLILQIILQFLGNQNYLKNISQSVDTATKGDGKYFVILKEKPKYEIS